MNRIKRTAVVAGLVLGLGTAGVAGTAATAAPGNGLGQAAYEFVTQSAPAKRQSTQERADRQAERRQHLTEDLAPLVANGTLTQAQADAVVETLAAKGPRGGHEGPKGERGDGRREGAAAAATALGMTPEQLREELHSGKSIAQVAEAKGVDVQTVTDAMVAAAKTRIEAKVADGSLTQEEADQRLAEITRRITDGVNKVRPAR